MKAFLNFVTFIYWGTGVAKKTYTKKADKKVQLVSFSINYLKSDFIFFSFFEEFGFVELHSTCIKEDL